MTKQTSPSPVMSTAPAARKASSPSIASDFVWGAGIECTFISHLRVDQFEWTQHNRFWRDDFKRLRDELGATALRYALPWHLLEPSRGNFDWSMADERLNACKEMGIDVYLDVMHFGTPLWLKQAAGDPEFPESLERFTAALVDRYGDIVKNWCPCNEPLVLALFSGDFGFWPPHARKWRGYMPVLSRVVQAASRSIGAIRRGQQDARVVWCDHVENFKTRDEQLKNEVRRRNLRRFLAMDLLLGRVDRHHPLFEWVTAYGMSELDLEWFRTNPQSPDVLGFDYYPNSDWQLDKAGDCVRQRRSETPAGLYTIAQSYYDRYGIPMMLTETSIDGQAINREIWLEDTVEDCRRLRADGIPMLGYFWWPMVDQVDWDGALTHRIGKIHEVGLFKLCRESSGALARCPTPLARQYAKVIADGLTKAGPLENIALPADEDENDQEPLRMNLSEVAARSDDLDEPVEVQLRTRAKSNGRKNGNGNGHSIARLAKPVVAEVPRAAVGTAKALDRYGIVVFCHLRWGFVWQRPQQFLSRFAKKHKVLFVEEPIFDLPESAAPRLDYHKVMPNVTVIAPHMSPSWNKRPELPAKLLEFTREAIENLNETGEFDRPVLWYYSPMDAAWSLGRIENRGVVYDCMDELSQFSGAPKALVDNEKRLMKAADIVFCGGLELAGKKRESHDNVHMFGCGVEYDHFAKAADPNTAIPPDIDFMARPILGWFGVIDERVDYAMIGEMARMRPDWSFAMVGPVVKVDPNLLPHAPNLFWLGGRDYQQLPHYCAAFDICMMCFALNRATDYINPTKGLEYMATGKPIISTPVRDVVSQWSDIVRIAKGAQAFVRAAEEALQAGESDPRIAEGISLAQRCSWESTVANMQDLIKQAISKKDRRSAAPVPPMAQTELAYTYCPTQGS